MVCGAPAERCNAVTFRDPSVSLALVIDAVPAPSEQLARIANAVSWAAWTCRSATCSLSSSLLVQSALVRDMRRSRACCRRASRCRPTWKDCTGTMVPRVAVGKPGAPAPHGGVSMRHRLR